MNIEEAIQQKRPFRNVREKAVVNLIYTTNWVRNRLKRSLKPFGLTMQQYNVLRILRGAGEPVTTSTIRERLLDKMSDTSRLVERLCQKGLVTRKVCPSDKRLVDVSITEEGRELLLKVTATENNTIDYILEQLSEKESEQLNQLLDKIRL